MEKNVIIFGASGKTGQELTIQALAMGYIVTAFVRNPLKLKITHDNLKVIQGSISDFEKVSLAIKGQDAVLSALGAASPFKFDQSVIDGTENIIKALKIEGTSRFIYMSFIGVKESRNTSGFVIKYIAPRLLSTEIAGHEARESMIKQSGLNWVIVRAATLTNGKHTGQYRRGEGVLAKGFPVSISRADVADFMLNQVTDDSFLRKAPGIMY
jgi:putative NADH-flavin reductase